MRHLFSAAFRLLFAALPLAVLPAQAQVLEIKNEYSHAFSYTPPGDTVHRVLRFNRGTDMKTGILDYAYHYPGYDREDPASRTPRPSLAAEIPALDSLLRTALARIPAPDSFVYLSLEGPYGWSDVMARQLEAFAGSAEWKAILAKKASESNTYEATRRIMLESGVYAALEPLLARYGYAIDHFHCAKISHLRAKDLAALGVSYTGKLPIPVPNEFGIYLRRTME